jgi:F-type H+-transporting ATPase subunit a
MFVFFCNLIGLIPYTFTVTSHIIVTFAFAGLIFIGVTLIGFIKNGFGYLRMFYPSGVPIYMAPIIIPIEVISYLTKPVSLSVRLMANMLAGHSIIKIFAGFIVMMGFFGIIPLAGLVAIYALEVFIAFLQAYIFTILTCIYLNDALHPHH